MRYGEGMLLFPDRSDRAPRAHFSGIGGTGMVAGARLAIEAGWEIRGSDNVLYPPTSRMVEALGVPVATQYAAANLDWGPEVVVVGNVLSRGNPEVEAALERGLHYVSLPEWLKDVVLRPRRPVVICGTHGKTTTTALTAHLLERCGLDPGYFIGGEPFGFSHSARLGPEGAPFVIEGDEYDTAFFDKRAKFFHYLPSVAVVTSVEFDHADIYRDAAEIDRAFRLMLRQIPASGHLIVCADDPGAAALVSEGLSQTLTYGLDAGATFRGEPTEAADGIQPFRVFVEGTRWGEFASPLVGRHNLANALAALAVGHVLGVEAGALAEALRDFPGVRRRMEVFLEARGVTFVDDFAHHPTAIRETVAAARSHWPGRKIRVLLEPRSNTLATNRFQRELVPALSKADEVWVGPIHRADAIPEERRLDRAALVAELESQGVEAYHTDDVDDIVAALDARAGEGDIVLILSNGAFHGIYERLRSVFTTK